MILRIEPDPPAVRRALTSAGAHAAGRRRDGVGQRLVDDARRGRRARPLRRRPRGEGRVSAHRMPDEMFAYAEAAAGRGPAGDHRRRRRRRPPARDAGRQDDRAGARRAGRRRATCSGQDSLLSIVQMPAGVPVGDVRHRRGRAPRTPPCSRWRCWRPATTPTWPPRSPRYRDRAPPTQAAASRAAARRPRDRRSSRRRRSACSAAASSAATRSSPPA